MLVCLAGLGFSKKGGQYVNNSYGDFEGLRLLVIREGTPSPLLEWVALKDFIEILEQHVPNNIYQTSMGRS
jgi:hypothetical protein